jgi:hypothetical protein
MSKLTSYFENATNVTQFPVTAGTADLVTPSVAADPQRKVVEFYNNDATNAIYVSVSPTYLTAQSNGRVIGAGLSWTDSATGVAWYIYASTGSINARVTVGK